MQHKPFAILPLTVLLATILVHPLMASAQTVTPATCSVPPPLPSLSNSRDRDIQKLSDFQDKYGYVGKRLAFFTVMPTDLSVDLDEADGVAAKLKAFAAVGVSPVVFIEPPVDLNLSDIADGVSRVYWREYFERLRSAGITAEQMGLWIPYPEVNTPIWNREWFEASSFPKLVNEFATAYKGVFPGAKAGLLFNSYSYEAADVGWEHGKAASYLPYVRGITKGNIDVVGIQAFPWFPRKNEAASKRPLSRPSQFLFMRLVVEAARELGTKGIMIHTGVPSSMHAGSPETQVFIPTAQRGVIMRGITTIARTYKRLGYDVTLSLFTEDKSNVEEGTDWSFAGSSAAILTTAARTVSCNGISLVMF